MPSLPVEPAADAGDAISAAGQAHRRRAELAHALGSALERMPVTLELERLSLNAGHAAAALLDELPAGYLLDAIRRRL